MKLPVHVGALAPVDVQASLPGGGLFARQLGGDAVTLRVRTPFTHADQSPTVYEQSGASVHCSVSGAGVPVHPVGALDNTWRVREPFWHSDQSLYV